MTGQSDLPRGSWTDSIFFTEGTVDGEQLGPIDVKLNRQNSNLTQVKNMMAGEAHRMGANAIIRFEYGQKSHSWWEQLLTFRWDSEVWYGRGTAVRASLPPAAE